MHAALQLTLRLAAAVGGGYALTAAAVPLGALLLAGAGMARSEATTLAMMLGFVFYLGVLLWAFSMRSVARLWAVLAGTTTAAAAALFLLN